LKKDENEKKKSDKLASFFMISLRYREIVHKYINLPSTTLMLQTENYVFIYFEKVFISILTVFLSIIGYSNQPKMKSMKQIISVNKLQLLHEVYT